MFPSFFVRRKTRESITPYSNDNNNNNSNSNILYRRGARRGTRERLFIRKYNYRDERIRFVINNARVCCTRFAARTKARRVYGRCPPSRSPDRVVINLSNISSARARARFMRASPFLQTSNVYVLVFIIVVVFRRRRQGREKCTPMKKNNEICRGEHSRPFPGVRRLMSSTTTFNDADENRISINVLFVVARGFDVARGPTKTNPIVRVAGGFVSSSHEEIPSESCIYYGKSNLFSGEFRRWSFFGLFFFYHRRRQRRFS